MTPGDLARAVVQWRSAPARRRLMPTDNQRFTRARVPAYDLARKLRLHGVPCDEAEVKAALEYLGNEGCVVRREGGWAVADWQRLEAVAA